MKIEELQKYFEYAESNQVRFEGKCHDCELPVTVDADLEADGKITVSGGALFNPQISAADNQLFLKCEACFEKDDTLQNYQPCAVYSRVVGYLRPVDNWNNGKKAEYKKRKLFKNV